MIVDLPSIPDLQAVPTGDMPGDRIRIIDQHVAKAQANFPRMWERLAPLLDERPHGRAVVAVHGGSGVGKSEIGSLLAYYLEHRGIGAYVLSGDNYPRRTPTVTGSQPYNAKDRGVQQHVQRRMAPCGVMPADVAGDLHGRLVPDGEPADGVDELVL